MPSQELSELARQIAEIQLQIADRKAIIERLKEQEQIADSTQVGVTLRALEDKLLGLLERRNALLDRLRQPRATSRSASGSGGRRKVK